MLGWEIDVHGGSSQALTGGIGLSEIKNVFAEVFICPETMELLQKSLREAHFEATVTCFEFPWQIGWKSRAPQFGTLWLRLRFDLASRFYPAPGRGSFILKGALPAGRPGFSSSGPGTRNFSFLFSGIFELRAASIYNQSQLGFFAGGFDGEPGAP